jgi:hypothetical protein
MLMQGTKDCATINDIISLTKHASAVAEIFCLYLQKTFRIGRTLFSTVVLPPI